MENLKEELNEALKFIQMIKAQKGVILFIGSKVSAKDITRQTAEKCQMPYVNERSLGGTLTNFKIIYQRLEYFRDLEEKRKNWRTGIDSI